MVIRKLEADKPSELDLLKQLMIDSIKDCPDAFSVDIDPKCQHWEEHELRGLAKPYNSNFRIIIAIENQVPLRILFSNINNIGHFWARKKGEGIGSKLFEEFLKWASSRSYRHIECCVNKNNSKTIHFFNEKNFKCTGEEFESRDKIFIKMKRPLEKD